MGLPRPDLGKRIALAVVLLVATVGLYFWNAPAPRKDAAPTALSVRPPVNAPGHSSEAEAPPGTELKALSRAPKPSSPQPPTKGALQPRDAAADPGAPLAPAGAEAVREQQADLEHVSAIIRSFRAAVGENPIGTNAEITSALRGDNLKQVRLDLPAGNTVNEAGELTDRWGTAYFFHQLSSREIEIRSAGPDRKMWTEDDQQVK